MNFGWIKGAGAAALMLAPALPLAAQKPAPTVEWLTGVWSDRADCQEPIFWLRDGRFFTPAGAEGRWRLNGDQIVISDRNGANEQRLTIERLGQNSLTANRVPSYRCQGRSPGN